MTKLIAALSLWLMGEGLRPTHTVEMMPGVGVTSLMHEWVPFGTFVNHASEPVFVLFTLFMAAWIMFWLQIWEEIHIEGYR